ncbi:F0F1 ATP synthase subunit B family protein [Rhodopirellula sp. P2]|uniref:F0F1 ATP synthase subunit B family protein n=1 Tax=Rhodopirellula sp. P2 TaxID=2127060 RepID=UPI002368EFB1|nr:F0F1 ATP synthase subunit B [Rhodopirellula sp. P2]WDQ14912.1 F0F1 ATP synthase subunit B [Rhodopirellula sp. P2]
MSIDWFTFTAQVINFLVLVGLLRYFLYGPIVRAMQAREQKVTQRLSDAEAAKAEANQQRAALEKQTQSLQEQREEMLAKAKADADSERQRMIAEARKEADTRREHWTSTFERDQKDLADQTRRDIQRMGFQAARETIEQLADEDLQRRVCQTFVKQLQKLDETQRTAIATQLVDSGNPVLVRSADDLDDSDRSPIRDAIHEVFQCDAEVRFESDPALIAGLEMDAGGYSLPWNAERALKKMEANVA